MKASKRGRFDRNVPFGTIRTARFDWIIPIDTIALILDRISKLNAISRGMGTLPKGSEELTEGNA